MIVVVGHFRLPAKTLARARPLMTRVIELSRAEPGCRAYDYAEDLIEPGLFRVSEVWTSREALAAHFTSPHMSQWQIERAGLGMRDRQITAYDVSGSEAL
jgi:quinol monooxygenase YgiN